MNIDSLLFNLKRGDVFSNSDSMKNHVVYQYYLSDKIFVFRASKSGQTVFPAKNFIKKEFSLAHIQDTTWKIFGTAEMLNTEEISKLLPGC